MPSIVKGPLEDALQQLNISDMSGGLATAPGPLALGPNQTPNSLNIFAYEGQLFFRGGYLTFCSLPAAADAAFTYVDTLGAQHLMIWSDGNLYDCRTGAAVLVATAVYTPGEQVGHCILNGTMYWATLTVPLRQYVGSTNTEGPVANGGGTGTVPPPAANFLVTYAGSIVAVYPVPLGVPEPSSFMWSDVNDPTTWYASAIQTVGSNDGSICTFAILMGVVPGGVTTEGIPATRQLLVGKDKENLFLYQGVLGTLTENAVPVPVGAVDAYSAVYIPTKEGIGAVMFLGNDGQMYLTNGNSAVPASNDIKNLVYQLFSTARGVNPQQRFNAVYNPQWQYYLIDFGNNTQLAYQWTTGAWWLFQGWPSGAYINALSQEGLPLLYVAAQGASTTGMYSIGLSQQNDNGNIITAFYTSPWLHGGAPEREKIFDRYCQFMQNVGVRYVVTATTTPRADGSVQTSDGMLMDDAAYAGSAASANALIWGQGLWGVNVWGGSTSSLAQPYAMSQRNGRFQVYTEGTKWMPPGPVPLRGNAIQVTIAWNGGVSDFRLSGFNIGLLMRSLGFAGNNKYTTEGQQT
jgi:hypothetical protein